MGSKNRMPPPHLRRPLPGPGIMHPDHSYGPGIHPPPAQGGMFPPPFDRMPPPEIMEQKLAGQHREMEKLLTENQRLASTHGTLRKELAAAQHELQMLQDQIGSVKADREHHMRNLMDKIAKMEAELQHADSIKMELQKAHENAQNLIGVRQELIAKAQQLSQDLQRTHSDLQQIPALISELESLRQEYQHCRATYDYEKKLYSDHRESLQVMEQNYAAMSREVEKLRGQLTNTPNVNGGPYGGGYNENEASVNHRVGQNPYEDGYGVPQGHGPIPNPSSGAPVAASASLAFTGGHPGPTPPRSSYEAPRVPGYDPQRAPPVYDMHRGPAGYNVQQQQGPGHDSQNGPTNYEAPRGHGFNNTNPQWGHGPSGQFASNNVPYGSAPPMAPLPPATGGGGYEAQTRGGNPVRR